ncbi:hypothetical protein [uncultured Prevotella sp.]|uniref:hypothetical protein n=1 Tax=uncultured Prevotella sp. TaxID=159272 RepID=UPI00259878D3|nr:hypothetical protein [uncultured Prevotella sp.]
MKKIIPILFALFSVSGLNAQSLSVPLVEVDHTIPNHNGDRYVVPQVDVSGGDITIKSDTLLTDVTVIVKDQCGSIIHVSSETIDNMGTIIRVPNGGYSEPSTIDLYYDDCHLRGDIVQ